MKMYSKTTTTNAKITSQDILNSMDRLSKINKYSEFKICYMSLITFIKLFPKIYELVWYDGKDWWFKGTYLKIQFTDNLPKNIKILFGKDLKNE